MPRRPADATSQAERKMREYFVEIGRRGGLASGETRRQLSAMACVGELSDDDAEKLERRRQQARAAALT